MSHSDDGQTNTGPRVQPVPIQGSSAPAGLRIVDSSDLLAGHSSLLIRHLGEVYRLQTTRQGKLILTK
ncbi:hemin uptake protein HemP [Limnohabitans sp. DCL3]|uniref:hemin uptake protein HemP n=1 Tax=Limnohabitans sp. DCL3 TaxID=3374103 RepID=UPI003A85985C